MAWSTQQVARIAGTTENTVRYYHRMGLLPQPERAANGYKRYEIVHLVQLLRIRRLRELGLPVSRIAALRGDDSGDQDDVGTLDADLARRIEQLERIRADLAQLVSHRAPLETPAGFAAFASGLSPTQQSLLAIYAQVFDAATLDAFRQALSHEEDTDEEFDRLAADADDETIEDLGRRMLTTTRRQWERFPELADAVERSPLGPSTAGIVLAHALVNLYNPAQLQVLRRHDALLKEQDRSASQVARSSSTASDDSQSATGSDSTPGGDASRPWHELASGYEKARAKEDSLDRLVEWPAQRELLGDVSGLSLLDVGCGNGGKLAELVGAGADAAVGIDISGNFITTRPPGLELIQGDLSELESVSELAGRRFDRILFLQSIGYATDPVRTLRTARAMLTDDGFILLTRSHPIRYALEQAEQKGTSLGEEYFSTEPFCYRHSGWNDQVALTKRPYTMSDVINIFGAAGLWIETAVEPQLSEDAGRRFPHKQAWMNKYLGILMFKLRPLPH